MRDSYLFAAQAVIPDPYILINVVSRRVKQLRRGSRPLVESLEKLSPEDIALREISEGKIGYALAEFAEATVTSAYQARLDSRATSRPLAEKTAAPAGGALVATL